MKNKIILLLFVVGIAFTSCQEDDPIFKDGATISANVSAITVFDLPKTIDFTVSSTDVTQLELMSVKGSTMLTVSGGTASYELTSADFAGGAVGIDTVTGYTVSALMGDYEAVSSFSVSVVAALSGSVPGSMEAYNWADTVDVMFGAETYGTSVDVDVTYMVKGGTEMDLDSGSGAEVEIEDMFWGGEFMLGDTIMFDLVATDGTLTESKSWMTVIVDKSIGAFMDGMVSMQKDSEGMMIADSFMIGDTAYFLFDDGNTIYSDEVVFLKNPDFSSISDPVEFSEFAELMTGVTDMTVNVVIGDAVGYMFTADNGDMYYGYFEVTDVMSTDIGDAKDGVYFSYRQNMKEAAPAK